MNHVHPMNFGKWDWASLYWALWFGVGFLPFELWALFTGRNHDTLSDNVWRLIGLDNGSPWSFAHFAVAAGMVWLLFHFVFGWFR
jgi:hypothetical protein